MQPFKFDLEKLLSLRKFKEEEIRVELGKVRSTIEKALSKKADFQAEYERALMEMRDKTGQMSAHEIQQFYRYLSGLKGYMKNQDLIVSDLRNYEKEIIEKYKDAMKDRKILEKLKEKKLDEYKYEAKKKEKKEIENLILMHHKPDSSFSI